MHGAPCAENRSRLQAGLADIFDQGLGGGELDADGAVLVAFLVDSKGGLLAVLVRLQKLLADLA
jgi:hypothetical protein